MYDVEDAICRLIVQRILRVQEKPSSKQNLCHLWRRAVRLTVIPMSLKPIMQTTYAAGQAVIIQVNITGYPDRVTAQMWYDSNDFINTGTTDLINEGNGNWCIRHNNNQGYDQVVIIPKNTPDGTYNITITAIKTINGKTYTQSITIPIIVKGTIYDYYHSEINN